MNIELKDKNNLRDSIELDRNLASKSEIIMASGRMIEQKQINDENKQFTKVPFFKLMYTFASRKDVFLLIGAVIGSLIAGTSMPFIALLLGKAINNFGSGMLDLGQEVLTEKITQLAIIYILVGLAIFLGSFMMVFFWTWVGKRIINKINEEYLRVIMRQEPGWFDANNVFELPTKIQGQIKTIENGIGNKVGQALMSISQFIASFLVGYITSWQLSLVLTAMLPLLIIGGWCMAKAMQQGSSANRESYEKSGGIAEEVLYQIKTVASFANFDYEVNKYNHWITQSMQAGIKSGFKAGFGIGFIIFVVYCSYSLAVGYGSYLISSQQVNTNSNQIFGSGDVITVLFAIIFGCLSLGQATPYVRAMYEAMYTASEFFTLMYRVPQIDLTESVEKPDRDKLSGHLSFKNVIFSYPTSPPGQVILDNININFLAGKKNAIVGGSGSGKSTMLYLMLRFYQPNIGGIYFDDYDLKRLDIKYWRSIIGYVPQEPVLFNTSIRNNIIFGREGITEEDILLACEKAYATDFVNEKGLDFIVGIKGSKLSGGQKQRIAIARAILTKPKLLILDEATSALDRKSEVEVQKALDIVSKDVTTVIIAHKIDTIKNSDMIVCLDNGKVVEQGKNDELLAKGSFYSTLVHSQEEKEKKDKQIKDERIREHINRLSLQGPIDANKIDLEILESIQEIAEEEGAFEEVEINDLNTDKNYVGSESYMEDIRQSVGSLDVRLSEGNYKSKSPDKSQGDTNRKISKIGKLSILNFDKKCPENLIWQKKIDEVVDRRIKKYKKQNRFKILRRRLFTMLKDDKLFVIGGAVAASWNGAVWPIYGIILADAIGALSESDMHLVSDGGLKVAMMFLALALVAALILWMQNYFFYGLGEILTRRFREMIFVKFLNFHMGYFDRPENSSGSLISKLSSDTTKINGIAISIIGQLLQTTVTLVIGITLAMTYDWRLCLINLGFLPLMIGTYAFQFKVQKGGSAEDETIEMESGSILSESVLNTKTIFSYNMEKNVVDLYAKTLSGFNKTLKKTSAINGLFYAASQFILFAMYATLFYAGGQFFFIEPKMTLQRMMRAILTILFSALGVGVAAAFVGDYGAAKKAIVSLYDVIDEPSKIDVTESEKKGVKNTNLLGKIEFRNVTYAYQTRPDFPIFKNLNFIIKPGQNVAFVGSSGSGKSTVISLIERFYDVTEGQILIDDIDIKEYDLNHLRHLIGLVSQEPALFKRNVKENIRYGRLDATDEEILSAATAAYIDDLINHEDLPVSGGQKQRIAIARAILKSPKILLLDEATSALDMEKEQLVQKSLDHLMYQRTCVVVAHRLTTIMNCDVIFVLEGGAIVENGSHQELMAAKGKYYNYFQGNGK